MERTNIYNKIINVISEISGVDEKGFNTYQKYNYKRQEDVINAIKPWLIKYRLLITSEVIEEETIIMEGKGIFCKVTMEFTIIDLDTGDQVIKKYKGHGIDNGDKSIYKAMTGAEKYFYMKNFLIGTPNDDPEYSGDIPNTNKPNKPNKANNSKTENKTQNISTQKNNSKVNASRDPNINQNPNTNTNPNTQTEKCIDVKLSKLLFIAAKQDQSIVLNAIKKFGYTATNQIKISEYKKVLEIIKKQVDTKSKCI